MIQHNMNIKFKKPAKKVKKIASVKAGAPGVPPHTCPYIDFVQHGIGDIVAAYVEYCDTGTYVPTTTEKKDLLLTALETIRDHADALRSNSFYWYKQYKQLNEKYEYYVTNNKK